MDIQTQGRTHEYMCEKEMTTEKAQRQAKGF